MLRVVFITTFLLGGGFWLGSGFWLKNMQQLENQPGQSMAETCHAKNCDRSTQDLQDRHSKAMNATSNQISNTNQTNQEMNHQTDYCELSEQDQTSWENCIGKLIKVTGSSPKVVMQHILRTGNPLGKSPLHQGYMDALNYQFVLLSKEPITCQGPFEVEGVLKRFSLNQADGTKGGYANYDIHVTHFKCL
ncbi:hypothetical protein ACN4EG_11100 [Alkalinema pantanalense CENA528]|uniref:hypothetical protein n=1 Tax=Alkalinema pantanalense TaxID=1620705 RepID=UPI003D701532